MRGRAAFLGRVRGINDRALAVMTKRHDEAHEAGDFARRDRIFLGAMAAGRSVLAQISTGEWIAMNRSLSAIGIAPLGEA